MIYLLIHILIALLVLGIFWVVIEWAIGQLPLPAPKFRRLCASYSSSSC